MNDTLPASENGSIAVESSHLAVEGMHRADAHVAPLPGIVIFVHGVNSEGEWYEQAEKGLCDGLNTRLGLDHAVRPDVSMLSPVTYRRELLSDGTLDMQLSGKTFIEHPGRSPVIRFRWGYKAAGEDGSNPSEVDEYKGKIYLNEMDAWGGGPFQNGTSALPYMWGNGLDDRVFWWLYANMFPVDGREIYACPPRTYFVLAAERLMELIKAIRTKQPDCPVTVVCHSQGNMVALAAAFLGEREGHVADTYVMCNPPYSLESLQMDQVVNHESRSAKGEFGGITGSARKQTFLNFLKMVGKRAEGGQPLAHINEWMGFKDPQTAQTRFHLNPFPADPRTPPQPGQDRDNRGRVFLYCNPHDQVIGVSPVQGMGWCGVSQAQLDGITVRRGEAASAPAIGQYGNFHQRVWAQPGGQQPAPFKVGAPEWTGAPYRYLAHHHAPGRFWTPVAPAMRFTLSLNSEQGWGSRIITIGLAPIFWVATRLIDVRINANPTAAWAVPITAPVLPEPVTPQALRYARTGHFDEGKDPSTDALDSDKSDDLPADDPYRQRGLGNADTEASLRYEHHARLRMRAAQHQVKELDPEAQRATLRKMLAENPNATDHGTILSNPLHSEKVVAYDVAVGWVDPGRITDQDLFEFRKLAHWRMVEYYNLNRYLKSTFHEYWEKGFRGGKQIHMHYTPQHMQVNASEIVDERERTGAGYVK